MQDEQPCKVNLLYPTGLGIWGLRCHIFRIQSNKKHKLLHKHYPERCIHMFLIPADNPFSTQTALIRSIPVVIGSEPGGRWDNTKLGAMKSQDEGWLIALMKRHPWCHEWLSVWDGTLSVIVQYTPSYSQCLAANLLDGGRKPFSYRKCIYSKHNILSPLHVHMRELIQPQIHRWVAEHTIVLQKRSCARCLAAGLALEVDHVVPLLCYATNG